MDERQHTRAIADLNSELGGDLGVLLDEAGTAAPGFNGQAAPELELAVDLVGLAAPDRLKAHALATQPHGAVIGLRHETLAEIAMGAVARHAEHVVEELVLRIGAEIRDRHFFVGDVGHQAPQVLDAIIDDAEGARGEARIAAGFIFRRAFEHQDLQATFLGCQGSAEGCIATANDNDVPLVGHAFHSIEFCSAVRLVEEEFNALGSRIPA